MNIAGLQKMTLLDYPGRVACTVFLSGCNFRCPFCHNSGLLGHAQPLMTDGELLAFLKKRQGLLDGVCVTGGEPTLSPGLPDLLRQIRSLGYDVKLDTNGTRPDVLKALVEEGLVQYVAMDIKNAPDRYALTAGAALHTLADFGKIEESIRFLLTQNAENRGKIAEYELRTTVVSPLHDVSSLQEMGTWLQSLGGKPRRFYLQNYVARDSVLRPDSLRSVDAHTLQAMLEAIAPYTQSAAIRGAG